ncbi:MAG: pyridoxamine 5'-phosphate oxidase [Acidobacteriota bacterium]
MSKEHHELGERLAQTRYDYARAGLRREDLRADPLDMLAAWLEEAVELELPEPSAMTLATVDEHGRPSARTVLLRGLDARGLTFYTNYESAKARELDAHPAAAVCFWWPALERQVRVEGEVSRATAAESDAYYAARGRGSRLGAWASPQSTPIADRSVLETRVAEIEERFRDVEDIPRPPFWGGFRLVPRRVEVWQGRPSRLHDRFAYTADGDGWRITRLAP